MIMAITKQCDRCGRLYSTYRTSIRKEKINGLILIDRNDENTSHYNRIYIDLCPECINWFSNWLNSATEEKNV